MAHVKGNLLYVDAYSVFDKQANHGSKLLEWFDSIPQSTILSVRIPRTVLRVELNGELIGTSDQEPGYSNVKKCIDAGWTVIALKRRSIEHLATTHDMRLTENGFEHVFGEELHQNGYVSFVGIGPDATDEERELYDKFVNARRRGIDCPALTLKTFAKFANGYTLKEIEDEPAPPKPKKDVPRTSVDCPEPEQSGVMKSTGSGLPANKPSRPYGTGCALIVFLLFIIVALFFVTCS